MRPPLGGLWTHTKGGFYHDGRFATLLDVVNHYDTCMRLGLSDEEKSDLVEYLKSLPNRKEAANYCACCSGKMKRLAAKPLAGQADSSLRAQGYRDSPYPALFRIMQ